MLAAVAAMRRGLLAAIMVCGLSLAGLAPAKAQIDLVPKFRIKAGIFLPQDGNLTNVSGSVWYKVAVDFNIPFGSTPVGNARLGIEYAGNGSSHVVPVLFGGVFQPSVGIKSPVYLGAAIGAYNIKADGQSSGWAFGGRILGGVDFTRNIFLEIQYDVTGKAKGFDASGFSIMLGAQY